MRYSFFFGAVLFLGCGGSEGSTVAAAAPDASPSSETPPPVTEADAAAPSDAGGPKPVDASSAPVDDRIDPIEVGHAWTYNVQVLGFYPSCDNGVQTATALETSEVDGKTAVHVQSLCKDAGTYTYSVDGDRVYSYFAGKWRISVDSPVSEGHNWTDGFRSYAWEAKGSVTTPAGTFANCWSAKVDASYDSYTVFCRGVGPVKWHYEDGYGNGYEAILTSKNF